MANELMDAPTRDLKIKVCMVGVSEVGKSSLIRRFVYDEFDDRYVYTLGAKVSKKVLDLIPPGGSETWHVILTLWDIMGDRVLVDLVKDAYFMGASGVIAVADLTRPETFPEVDLWIGAVKEIAGRDTPVVLLGNKLDLVNFRDLDWSPLAGTAAAHSAPLLPTSARSGANVETAFSTIARLALVNQLKGLASSRVHNPDERDGGSGPTVPPSF